MAEPNKILRLTASEVPSDLPPPVLTGEPVVPTGDLARVVDQLQARLASLEKRRAAARKKPAPTEATASQDPTSALEARLREFRELESALQVEKLALHTRLRAAEQEELLLRHESLTLQLKLKSFRIQTQKLRAEEAEVARRVEELRIATEQAAKDRQQIEQARHELEQLRQQLDREQSAPLLRRAAAKGTKRGRDSTIDSPGSASRPVEPAITAAAASPASRSTIAASLIILCVAAIAGLAIAGTWLTVQPIYRASATLTSTSGPIAGAPDVLFDQPVLDASLALLRQRGLQPFDSPAALASDLKANMTADPSAGNHLMLTYDNPLREQAVFILEALTRSYVAAHPDAGVTITRAAAADLFPVRDDRPRTAIIGFGLGTAALALVAMMIRTALRRRAVASK